MKIGVDGTCWANRRGYGRYARELFRALVAAAPADQFVCFVDDAADRVPDMAGANVRKVRVGQSASPTEAARADGNRSPADMLRFSRAVWSEKVDVFLSPSVYTFFPLPPGLPAVVCIHDAIAERFPHLTLPSRKARVFWGAKVALAIRQADLILTVSDFAARELEEVLRIPAARIRVAVEAPAEAYRPEPDPAAVAEVARRVGLPPGARWFVYVGGFNPHKNVDVLARAHARLVGEGGDAPFLVLVGDVSASTFHGNLEGIREAVRGGGAAERVLWPGFVGDDDLSRLHTGALALVLPSANEGFGLPAVEAAACGCPVVATEQSPLPQLLDGGGLFVAPGDEAALLDALRTMARDEPARARMGRAALAGARALRWDEAAHRVMGALREAAA